jgi:hypothetical protein
MKLSTKELLKIVSDDSTESSILEEVWAVSRSVNVRKAIAANPNASPRVLRAAARLYMEEVLSNPGFEMLRLFDDDPWIKQIGNIYDSPKDYFGLSRFISYRTEDLDDFGRAALVSPNCDGASLSNILAYVPVSSIKRVIKNESIKQRLRGIIAECYETGVSILDMEGLFKAWDTGLIHTIELASYIRKSGAISSMSCRKGVYLKTFRKLDHELVMEKTPDSVEAFISIFLMSRGNCFNWCRWEINQRHLPIIADSIKIASKIKKDARRGKTNIYKSYVNTALRELCSLFVELTWAKKSFQERRSYLTDFYELTKKYELPPIEWGSSKHCWPTISLDRELSEELQKLPIQVKTFYAKSMCLGSWFHMTKSEPKHSIAMEVNEWLYKKGGVGNLLYNKTSLKKIIALDDSVVIP